MSTGNDPKKSDKKIRTRNLRKKPDHLDHGSTENNKNTEESVGVLKTCSHLISILNYYLLLVFSVCSNYCIEIPDTWYKYYPNDVKNGDAVTILWNYPILTDRTLMQIDQTVIKDFKKRNLPTDMSTGFQCF